MTRQNITPDSSVRLFEAYMDFSGGLNSQISNERLKPNEFPILQNVDLSGRASARRRTGRTLVATQAGVAQGMFPFYRGATTIPDWVVAVDGKLYVMASGTTTLVQIPITDSGSPWTFQATLPVEAVQYQGSLFVATGTKLVEVSFTTLWVAVTVTPYTPTVQEAIYIGVNALSPNPMAYIADGVATPIVVVGISPAKRQGAVNVNTTLTAYINKPSGVTSIDYKWEYKRSVDTAYTLGRDFTAGAPGKSWDLNVSTATDYDIKVTVRDTAVPATVFSYTFSGYTVTETAIPADLTYTGIQSCRKVLLYWDRIMLYGDSTNPHQMYISDLQNPRFFPSTNSINFDTGKREAIQTIVKFQSYLVIFTNTSIQTLVNKDPSSYERFLIHDSVGCISQKSAQVIGNQIIFQSYEGIQSLTPNPYRVETMSVKRADIPIASEVPKDSDACSLFFDNQYWLCFPSKSVIYRYYFESGIWAKDVSKSVGAIPARLNITQFAKTGNAVYNLTTDGNIFIHDNNVYKDVDNVYDMIVETKLHDLSASFNNKKLRRLYLIGKHTSAGSVNLKVKVFADASIVLTPEDGSFTSDGNGYLVWLPRITPNFHFYTGSKIGSMIIGTSPIGSPDLSVQRASINGKCRRMKLNITHSDPIPCELYGFGVEFKLKKP